MSDCKIGLPDGAQRAYILEVTSIVQLCSHDGKCSTVVTTCQTYYRGTLNDHVSGVCISYVQMCKETVGKRDIPNSSIAAKET